MTFEQAAQGCLKTDVENNPKRRPHRVGITAKALAVIYRTMLPVGGKFVRLGDKRLDSFKASDIELFRDQRRQVLRQDAQKRAERAAKLAAGDTDAAKLPVPHELPRAQAGEVSINRSLELMRACSGGRRSVAIWTAPVRSV